MKGGYFSERMKRPKTNNKSRYKKSTKLQNNDDAKPDKNWYELALETLADLTTETITLSYKNKFQKYFNKDDHITQSLILSATASKKTGGTIQADIKTSKYPGSLNTRVISSTIEDFENNTNDKKVTYQQIINALKQHTTKSEIVSLPFAKMVRKIPLINSISQNTMSESKSSVMGLVTQKSIASIKFAKMTSTTYAEDIRLGYFGFIFHPMQTYRNWRTKQLVSELRKTQHITRTARKGTDITAWQATLFKYLLYGAEAQTQGGTNDNARRALTVSYNKLEGFYKSLEEIKEYKDEKITDELINNINMTIDDLMDADAQLKYITPKISPS